MALPVPLVFAVVLASDASVVKADSQDWLCDHAAAELARYVEALTGSPVRVRDAGERGKRGGPTFVLALDEADRLLGTDFYRDFFALVRSWHNSRALDDRWNKLNIAMVISTEPYLLIDDVTQSPFNVGLNLYLQDFDKAQVRNLNRQHGSPVKEGNFPQLMELLSGHPYLTRKALYTLVSDRLTWVELVRVAPLDHGPFGDHLRHHHWLLRDEPGLRKALKQVILHARCTDDIALFRLLRAGLVKGSGDVCRCRCDLYRMYFEDKL